MGSLQMYSRIACWMILFSVLIETVCAIPKRELGDYTVGKNPYQNSYKYRDFTEGETIKVVAEFENSSAWRCEVVLHYYRSGEKAGSYPTKVFLDTDAKDG